VEAREGQGVKAREGQGVKAREGWGWKRAGCSGGAGAYELPPEPAWTGPINVVWTGSAQASDWLGR
jgi:hypothetical protein